MLVVHFGVSIIFYESVYMYKSYELLILCAYLNQNNYLNFHDCLSFVSYVRQMNRHECSIIYVDAGLCMNCKIEILTQVIFLYFNLLTFKNFNGGTNSKLRKLYSEEELKISYFLTLTQKQHLFLHCTQCPIWKKVGTFKC